MHIQIDRAAVEHLPLFAALEAAELDQIVSVATGRRYRAADVVFEQGQDATHFFVLARGRLRVTQVTSEGQQVVIRMVNPGDLFGIAKALARTDYPGTATAVAESCALCWPMQQWTGLLERFPTLAIQAMQTMGSRLLEVSNGVED